MRILSGVLCLSVLLSIASCKPIARDQHGLLRATDTNKKVVVKIIPSKIGGASLVGCTSGQFGACYNLLRHPTICTGTAFYQECKLGLPYRFHTLDAVIGAMEKSKKNISGFKRSILIGVAVLAVGLASVGIKQVKRFRKQLEHLDNLSATEDYKDYSDRINSVAADIYKDFNEQDVNSIRFSIKAIVRGENSHRVKRPTFVDVDKWDEKLKSGAYRQLEGLAEKKERAVEKWKLAIIASLASIPISTSAYFVSEMMSDKKLKDQTQNILNLFNEQKEVTLSLNELTRFLKILTKYLPAVMDKGGLRELNLP